MYSAGLACFVDGAKTTTVIGCHVSILLSGSYKVHDCANFGGFVALVKSTSYEPLVFRNCSFMDYDARRMDVVRVSKNDQGMFSQCREIALKIT